MPRSTTPLEPQPRRKAASPPEKQHSRGRHLFLAEMHLGHFALRFSYGQHGQGSTLILSETAYSDTRPGPTRLEKAAYRWGDGHGLFARDVGFQRTQRLWLRPAGVVLLRTWNQTYGDPFQDKNTTGR